MMDRKHGHGVFVVQSVPIKALRIMREGLTQLEDIVRLLEI